MNFENMAENIQELCANGASQSDLIDYLLNSFNESPLMQILTDPENQPSQYGTVPLNWYENLENKIERMRFNVGEVIDSLDGSYEKHRIRKKLQLAID